jgi:hypothetical protein
MNVHYKDYLRKWRLWISFLIMVELYLTHMSGSKHIDFMLTTGGLTDSI